ncbi:11779_t:CDS:2, partial [Acaulospora colombiana]
LVSEGLGNVIVPGGILVVDVAGEPTFGTCPFATFAAPVGPDVGIAVVAAEGDPGPAANSNGVIGSGAALTTGAVNALQGGHGGLMGQAMNGMGMGPVTPYFDMTAATAGSDAAQEYFPPMPITTSLTSAIQSMSLSNNNSGSSAPPGTESTGVSTASASGPSSTKEEEPPTFLEPVGVGRDGFPSLSAKASDSVVDGPNEGVSRTGFTEWVTTPDDLPGGASLRRRKLEGRKSGPVVTTMKALDKEAAKERSISADQVTTLNSMTTPPSSSRATTGSTSPPSGGSGPIYSSSKKPKLTLGPIPKFSPDARLAQHYASMAMNKGSNGGNGPKSPPSTAQLATRANSNVYGTGSGGGNAATGGVNNVLNNPGFAAAVGINANALKINGTPNGFRDSLNVDPETGAMRRASWTEDASRRQTIVQALGSEQAV